MDSFSSVSQVHRSLRSLTEEEVSVLNKIAVAQLTLRNNAHDSGWVLAADLGGTRKYRPTQVLAKMVGVRLVVQSNTRPKRYKIPDFSNQF